ncbi:MAG: hypothetical protein ACYC44_05115 [Patescibacteria group bacterium]
MLKSKSNIHHDRPVYREVIPQALKIAWKHPHYWVLGIFAAVLNSGSALDACWKFFNAIQNQGSELFIGDVAVKIWQVGTGGGFSALPFFQALLALFALCVIILAVAAFSCISQGALVHNIGSWKDGVGARLKVALKVGSRALVPIAVLNLIILAAVWLTRFFVSLPLALILGRNNGVFVAVYLVSFIVFFALALVLSILQVYALNAMILQGAPLAQAFGRAWLVFKQHWLVTIETALLQAVVVLLSTIVALVIFMFLCLPPAILYILAIFRQNFALFQLSSGVFIGLTFLFLAMFTGFTVTFQYALWTLMFRKFGEGGVVAKIHRIFRFVTHRTKVPQS